MLASISQGGKFHKTHPDLTKLLLIQSKTPNGNLNATTIFLSKIYTNYLCISPVRSNVACNELVAYVEEKKGRLIHTITYFS